jgi:hypothetical protein
LKEKRNFEKEKLLNCMCTNSKLSQQKGSPQQSVPLLSQFKGLAGKVCLTVFPAWHPSAAHSRRGRDANHKKSSALETWPDRRA